MLLIKQFLDQDFCMRLKLLCSGGFPDGSVVTESTCQCRRRRFPTVHGIVVGHDWATEHAMLMLLSCFSRVQLCVTPRAAACQAPLSMGFSRQQYWSGLPSPPPGHLPNLGIEPRSPALQADYLPSEPPGKQHTMVRAIYWNEKD